MSLTSKFEVFGTEQHPCMYGQGLSPKCTFLSSLGNISCTFHSLRLIFSFLCAGNFELVTPLLCTSTTVCTFGKTHSSLPQSRTPAGSSCSCCRCASQLPGSVAQEKGVRAGQRVLHVLSGCSCLSATGGALSVPQSPFLGRPSDAGGKW